MPQQTLSPTSSLEELESFSLSIDGNEDLESSYDEPDADWRYNPDRINAQYRQRPFLVLGRLINILLPFAAYTLGLWWDKFRGISLKNERKRAIQLREILTQLGPAYIKVGQALSTRPDLVSPVYLDELAKLQDQLPSFPNEVAFRFIEEELGETPDEIYAELSPQPIAAASLGQVYKGRLKTGEEVAVKVQRPDLTRRITLDIYIMRSIASWAQHNLKQIRSNLVAITDELAERIFEEINYMQEGRNAERFRKLYGYLEEIYIPKIYWEYTGRRVLTMEWVSGTKLTNIKEIQAQGIDATHLVEVGVECSLRQLLEHGFFHADPHPGNLLAMPDGRLAYLDFGMMSRIKPYQRYGLIEAVVHLVNRDFEALSRDYVKLDFLTPDTDLTPIVPALANVFGNALGASVAELNFKSITDQMSAMMYEFPFRVPAYYALIIRSMVTLEGIAIGIEPDFKVLSKAYPYVAKRLLTDPAPELRASLKDLLFKEEGFRWHRLENLMRNANDSRDYNFDKIIDQVVDFLFSERGAFIRDRIADELVNAIDNLGRRTWYNLSTAFRQQVGLTIQETPSELQEESYTVKHLKNIIALLQKTPGFDPTRLISVVTKIITKPETHQLGQTVAERLAQKMAARLIRNLLLETSSHSIRTPQNIQSSLPTAAMR
ncbi:ABC-1 domain-containing protein [Stanieria cyanosphaera PCC 7437]|uniref:ABC-1 domain-containing protein n=1 Tax=Stanieria cyanosphaera (strain ATCC 29371 / PCC 7437) TaxID=111780 RepID=K9XY76_STAC7|nr:AarF/ABC1/UbiB kinase family protein [Stanieria cyanosphaera]AFZ36597.1 ABC-1 domain-containing protein [Stanieria cyanosphaera PCC 7437]